MNIFKIFGTIALDGKDKFDQDIDDATGKGSKLASALGTGLKTAAKVGVAAVSAAATGVVALTKSSFENYAEYEQLVGGTELMFGEAFDFVMDKAANAYSAVQMSQNEYLQQVNGFATGLKTSLNGDAQAAAELADKIITAEADIVAATGNSQEAVQNAFNGIMKGNYTMLDNLQLGITPTKEGFQEVIDKVNEWNAANGKATAYQIDNLADCEAALVDYVEMQGLAGYAANEASKTISGSIASMKSAWQNLVVGLADESADLDTLIDNFVNSVGTVSDNIMPRIEKILGGIGSLVQKLAPKIGGLLPQLVNTILPQLIQAGIGLVNSLIEGIRQNLDAIVSSGMEVVMMLLEALGSMIPDLILMGIDIVIALIDGIASNPDTLVETAITLISTLSRGLLQALPELARAATDLIAGLISSIVLHLPEILLTGVQLVLSLVGGAGEALAEMMKLGEKVVQSIIDGIAGAWDGLVSWFSGLWDSLFGKRDVNVNVNKNAGSNAFGGGINGSHASGLNYVPFNGYIAELHKGEMVVPAAEAQKMRNNTTEEKNIIINLTTTLDGKVIGETSYKYAQDMALAMGV